MALRFAESFDHMGTPSSTDIFQAKWTSHVTGAPNITAAGARSGSYGYQATTNQARTFYQVLDSQRIWIIGLAWKVTGNGPGAIVGVYDAGSAQCDLRYDSASSHLTVTRAGTLLATGTTVLSLDTWYYLEVKFTVGDATGVAGTWGAYEVHINGVTEAALSATNVDTKATANSTADQVRFTGSSASFAWSMDDIYICDGNDSGITGAPNNDFLGDVRVEYCPPSGDGNYSQWTGSDGNQVNNYALVDEAAPTGDTDYVEDSNVGDIDTYAYTDITPTTGSIYGVQVLPYARKTDAGTRSIRTVSRLSGTDADNGSDKTLSTTYAYYPTMFQADPAGNAWTLAHVNSAEFGAKLAS